MSVGTYAPDTAAKLHTAKADYQLALEHRTHALGQLRRAQNDVRQWEVAVENTNERVDAASNVLAAAVKEAAEDAKVDPAFKPGDILRSKHSKRVVVLEPSGEYGIIIVDAITDWIGSRVDGIRVGNRDGRPFSPEHWTKIGLPS